MNSLKLTALACLALAVSPETFAQSGLGFKKLETNASYSSQLNTTGLKNPTVGVPVQSAKTAEKNRASKNRTELRAEMSKRQKEAADLAKID